MAWIKRNLLFVVGLAVSAALIAAGAWYAYDRSEASDAAYQELTAKDGQLDGFVKSDPYPNAENIQKAKAEQHRLEQFKASAQAHFREASAPVGLDTAGFKTLLENTISGLIKDAAKAGVTLPDKYSFTFTQQRKDLQLAEKTLGPMALQLADISEICHILYDSKVHSILYVKRTPAATNEVSQFGELLAKRVVKDPITGATRHFYEVGFEGFSAELAAALTGFRDAQDAFVVRTVNVERGSKPDSGGAPLMDPAAAARMQMMARYSGNARYMSMIQPAAPVAAPKANEPVLEPKPLRITLGLEIIKLPPSGRPAAGQAER